MKQSEKIEYPIALMTLTDKEFLLISQLVYKRWGIKLGEQKRSLIAGRLQKILRKEGLRDFKEYYDWVLDDSTGAALDTLINRISTNHTFFYRENDHFSFFKEILLHNLTATQESRGSQSLRIWCPGCSTGEEPYTIAMLLLEYFNNQFNSWDIGVLATDISTDVLEKAKTGEYTDENASRLPHELRLKYFDRINKDTWSVKPRVRQLVLFKRLNLMRESYPFKGRFHVIFCRNVMIYFDNTTRNALVKRFSRYTESQGYLFIGHSESLGRNNQLYRYVNPAIYQKI